MWSLICPRCTSTANAILQRRPSIMTPPGVRSETQLVKGEDLNLECIAAGLWARIFFYFYIYISFLFSSSIFIINGKIHTNTFSFLSPTPQVEWVKMSQRLPTKAKIESHGKLLIVPDVEQKDGGKYMCKAKNSLGEAVHYFTVTVEGISFPDLKPEVNGKQIYTHRKQILRLFCVQQSLKLSCFFLIK